MRKLFFAVAVGLIMWALVVVPLPLLALSPVEAQPVAQIIEVGQTTEETPRDLLFTAVEVRSTTAVGAIAILTDPARDLVFTPAVVPPGVDTEEFRQIQERLFEESVRAAAAVGLREAGLDVTIEGDGAEVVQTIPRSPAADELQAGDVITAVEEQNVSLASQAASLISQQDPDGTVTLTIRRDGSSRTVEVGLRPSSEDEAPTIGVLVRTRNLTIELPVDVTPATDVRIGGPSAGLMIALAVFDAATAGDLSAGKVVAGTGTIDLEGRVGRVSGVAEKVRGAVQAGADVFLVAPRNADVARNAAPGDLEVVPVETLQAAIEALGG